MLIRTASLADHAEILKIYQHCRLRMEEGGIFQWTNSYPKEKDLVTDLRLKYLYKITVGGEITGVVTLNKKFEVEYKNVPWENPEQNALIVHRLAISPEHQGRGLGGKLMLFAEQLAAVKDLDFIRLDAYSGNPGALGLYQKLGYRKKGEIMFPERELPFICLEKCLIH